MFDGVPFCAVSGDVRPLLDPFAQHLCVIVPRVSGATHTVHELEATLRAMKV